MKTLVGYNVIHVKMTDGTARLFGFGGFIPTEDDDFLSFHIYETFGAPMINVFFNKDYVLSYAIIEGKRYDSLKNEVIAKDFDEHIIRLKGGGQ